jgi:putative ABC transport system ATP-binding protein
MNPLSLVNVVKCFHQGDREVRALDGLSLEVEPGQFVAVMGQSGSGKSTLLHLAAGLTQPESGQVRVAGNDLGTMTDRALTLFRRRHIGLVFQSFNLIPTLTAEENVALPLMLDARGRGSSNGQLRPKESALALLERLNLGHRLGHRPDAMSGGEQQRVAIARALVTEPDLILADEPTGNLDTENGRAVCELLRRLAEEGRTIVMVTHEPTVAAYAGRVVVLRDGQMVDAFDVASGNAGEVATRYMAGVARTNAGRG